MLPTCPKRFATFCSLSESFSISSSTSEKNPRSRRMVSSRESDSSCRSRINSTQPSSEEIGVPNLSATAVLVWSAKLTVTFSPASARPQITAGMPR